MQSAIPSYQVKADETGVVAMRVPNYKTINTDANARIWLRWNKDLETSEIRFNNKTVNYNMNAEGLVCHYRNS